MGGDPYLIALLENLCWMTQDSSSLGSYFKQAVDIDAFTTSGWNDRKGFSPIGNLGSPFIDSYNGDNHTVNEIFISRPSDKMVGAFGYVSGSRVVENIGAISVNINGIILLVAL